jgi:transaldolase
MRVRFIDKKEDNMSVIHSINKLGQSMWLDYISRSFIKSGELHSFINLGISGMTSNPTIFEKAIVHSSDYDPQIMELAHQSLPISKIYYELVITDIRLAADSFREIYDQTEGKDGYVSLEVNPLLAHDTFTTKFIDENSSN